MFSSTVMDHFERPRNAGSLEPPCGVGESGSREMGRWAQFTLRVEDDRVTAARFRTYGCVPAIAACSCLAEWVEGLTVDEIRSLTARDLIDRLGGLPPTRLFCAALALDAMLASLGQALAQEAA